MDAAELAAYAAGGSAVAGFGSLVAAACALWIRWEVRWAELTPLFEFTLTEGQFQVLLLEPVGLDLKKVKIRIVDEAGQPHGQAGSQPGYSKKKPPRSSGGRGSSTPTRARRSRTNARPCPGHTHA